MAPQKKLTLGRIGKKGCGRIPAKGRRWVARKENRGKELEPMGGGRKEKGDSPNGGARIGQPTRASDPTPRRTLVLSRGESHARKNARKLRAKSSCSVAAF